jgi:rhodanese-related sulfurtransferase
MAPAPAAKPNVAASTTAAPPAADVPAIPESREPLETGLALVRRLYDAKAAVFVDARGADEYAEGHIAGAISVPFDEVFRDAKRLDRFEDRGLPVVTYCGGGDCDLSRNLAFSIIDTGRRRVVVYLGGLPEWQQAGLPVNKGEKP